MKKGVQGKKENGRNMHWVSKMQKRDLAQLGSRVDKNDQERLHGGGPYAKSEKTE